MLIESELEKNVVTSLSALVSLADAEIVAARAPAADGEVKGEGDEKKYVVSVAIDTRQHDEFSLPTVNLTGTVKLLTRVELCPTGAEHEVALEAIVKLFTAWHIDAESMTAALSVDGAFYAAGLRMDGGTSKVFDEGNRCWTETINFTVRGTVLGAN